MEASSIEADGFTVNPGALMDLADRFDGAADQVSHSIAAFSATAGNWNLGTFGLLPSGVAAGRVYLQVLHEGVEGLRALHRTLGARLAPGLRACARNYIAGDQDVADSLSC